MRLACPSGVGNKPAAHDTVPAMAIAGSGMRSRQRVMVPILLRMALHRAFDDLFSLEQSRELSQSDTSEHILLAAIVAMLWISTS
jgi:hypothetical protein